MKSWRCPVYQLPASIYPLSPLCKDALDPLVRETHLLPAFQIVWQNSPLAQRCKKLADVLAWATHPLTYAHTWSIMDLGCEVWNSSGNHT